jgi:hypothetical protein
MQNRFKNKASAEKLLKYPHITHSLRPSPPSGWGFNRLESGSTGADISALDVPLNNRRVRTPHTRAMPLQVVARSVRG